ncbi:MAG TPA: glycosyltransferase family 39 protein [Candidatus Dormibacteraeota bacterium]|nr:glycosyltransferase family 39 protein [Candidatus Dormibacteraeota bacterium]
MRGPVRYLVYLIVIAALGLRLGFVLTSPARALYWDEPSYHRVAIGYLRALGGTTEPTPGEAVRLGLYRGEVYTATVALVYALFGEQPRAVFVLQALFDTATCLMLFGLARAVGGGRAGVIALTLAALYEPFIFSAARLQTETMTSLLYVGGLWMLCVPQRRRTRASFCAGVLIAAAMLARPAMQWLFPPLLPAVLVRNSDRAWRARLTVVLVFAGGFLVVVGPRLLFTRALLGAPAWSGTLKAGQDLYSGAVFANVGWKTDGAAYADPPRDELLAVIGDPPTRRPLQDDMRAAAVRIWRLHPMESAAVTLHKLYAAWLHPYNDSQWSFLTGVGGQERWHRLLLVLALIGMPLSLRRWRVAVVLLVTTLYLWLTYVVVKIEVRYAVMAMPMMICFAGVALAVLSTGAQRAWRAGQRTRLVTLAAVTAGLVGLTTVSIPRLLQWLPLTPEGAHGARVAVILALIVWLAHVAAALAGPWWRRSTALVLLMPSVTTAALVVLVGRPLAQDWREWQATLAPDRGIVSQEIVVPAASERAQSAELNFDLLPGPAGTGDVVVRLNGQEIKRYRGGMARADGDLSQDFYYQWIVAARGRTQTPDRAWYRIPIPPELVVPGNRLTVELALEGDRDASGSLEIFGDYAPDAIPYPVPSLFSPQRNADTSVYKYIAEGDFRLRRPLQLADASRSRFHDGHAWSEQDLGTDPGRQSGRYRIFLVLDSPRGVTIL